MGVARGGQNKKKYSLRSVVRGVRGKVIFQAPLREYTSLRIGGPADALVVPADVEDLATLVRHAHKAHCPTFVMGGTNLLVRDGGIRGVVISLAHLRAMHDEGQAVLYAEAGAGMPLVIRFAVTRSLKGLEWAAGIPGTVGGCVAMNAGTRLGDMQSVVKAVRILNPQGHLSDYPSSALTFSYRKTLLPRGIVVGVWVQLCVTGGNRIGHVVKEYLKYRKDTQPLTLPNAGCVFKNPGPEAAGSLIERVGLKGARVGDAQVSEKHANFVVNRGRARAADVVELIHHVGRTVERQTGVTLHLELTIVGQP